MFDDDDLDFDAESIDKELAELEGELGSSVEGIDLGLGDIDSLLEGLEGNSKEEADVEIGAEEPDIEFEGSGDSDVQSIDLGDLSDLGEDSEGSEEESDEPSDEEELEDEPSDAEKDELEDEEVHNNDFINEDGEVSVMDTEDDGHGFTFAYVDVDNIAVAATRIRKDKSFMSLQKSIRNTGILEPLVVAPLKTKGFYVLIHGYRRLQAGLREGIKVFPCVVNNKIKTSEIPVIEAIYNHTKKYDMPELKDYITYLEKDKGIMSASMIEFLCQLSSGDYAKLRDVWDDGDPDINEKLNNGAFSISQAFNALEKRRKKESKEEQSVKAADKAYESKDGVFDDIGKAGETGDANEAMSEEDIEELGISSNNKDKDLTDDGLDGGSSSDKLDPTKLDEHLDDKSLDEMVDEGKDMEGFEAHQQDPNNREIIDPAIRKAVMSRDNNTCQCCKRGGPDYVDILDLHHIQEVYLGGKDTVENGIAVCLNCHKQIHLYAFNKLHIPKSKTEDELNVEAEQQILAENAKRKAKGLEDFTKAEEDVFKEEYNALYKQEQDKYKRIVKLGNIIREGMQRKGMKLEDAKKSHPIDKIGRQKPGQKNAIA